MRFLSSLWVRDFELIRGCVWEGKMISPIKMRIIEIYIYMWCTVYLYRSYYLYIPRPSVWVSNFRSARSIFKWLYKGLKFQTLGGYRYIFIYVCGYTCWMYSKGLRGLVGLACFKIWLIFQPAMLVYRTSICLLAGHHSTTYKVGPYQLAPTSYKWGEITPASRVKFHPSFLF